MFNFRLNRERGPSPKNTSFEEKKMSLKRIYEEAQIIENYPLSSCSGKVFMYFHSIEQSSMAYTVWASVLRVRDRYKL